uniref:Eukaryotic translation initiation factor 3 subunit K n=1 Tax=Rhabditophanes sp. KR3021 TaxID=114890 RepID=A0AC35TW02_9BILA
MDETFDQLSAKVAEETEGINRYNPGNIPLLEKLIDAMVSEKKYDKDVLLTTLKLFQLNTQYYNEPVVVNILLKTMTVFPRNDFAIAKYLLDTDKISTPEIKAVLLLGEILETCNFPVFWSIVRGDYVAREGNDEKYRSMSHLQKLIKSIPGFEDETRRYVSSVVDCTFQQLEKTLLAKLLNVPVSKLPSYQREKGWLDSKTDNKYVFIANHEDSVKSKNIDEKMTFESKLSIISDF